MIVAALALSMLLTGEQTAKEPVHQPDRVREGCGYMSGSRVLVPLEIGVFIEGEPSFADAYGQAIRLGTRWVHPDQAPYPTGASRAWYRDSDPITFEGRRYVKYGLPRVLALDEVEFAGEHDGLAVVTGGTLPGQSAPTLFVLTGPASCEFQPYWPE